MSDITVRRGQTYQLPVTIDDNSASDVTLEVWSNGNTIISATSTFTNGEATIDCGIIKEQVGTYDALIKVNYTDGAIDILPLQNKCMSDEHCNFFSFQVCEGLPEDE